MAFNTFNRGKLWIKLIKQKIPLELLKLIMKLHEKAWTSVILGKGGAQSARINTPNGLRLGSILAPILFSLNIVDVPDSLNTPRAYPPKLNGVDLPAVFYADDTIIMDQTPIGLQHQLDAFSKYCKENDLIINTSKTQVMVFSRGRQKRQMRNWFIDGCKLVVTSEYRYLGLLFTLNLSFREHFSQQETKAMALAATLKKLDVTLAYKSVVTLMRLYNAKIVPLLLYGTEIMTEDETRRLAQIEMRIWKKWLDLPLGSVNSVIRLELGLTQIAIKHWQRVLGYRVAMEQAPNESFRGRLRNSLLGTGVEKWCSLVNNIMSDLAVPALPELLTFSKGQRRELIKEACKKWSHCKEQEVIMERPNLKHLWEFNYKGTIQPYLTWILPRDKRRWLLKIILGQVARAFYEKELGPTPIHQVP